MNRFAVVPWSMTSYPPEGRFVELDINSDALYEALKPEFERADKAAEKGKKGVVFAQLREVKPGTVRVTGSFIPNEYAEVIGGVMRLRQFVADAWKRREEKGGG